MRQIPIEPPMAPIAGAALPERGPDALEPVGVVEGALGAQELRAEGERSFADGEEGAGAVLFSREGRAEDRSVAGREVASEDDGAEPGRREGGRGLLQAEQVLSPVEIAVDEETAAPVGPAREGVEERELVRVDGCDLDGRDEERPERGGAAKADRRSGERGAGGDCGERKEEQGVPNPDVVGRPGRKAAGRGGARPRRRRRSGATRAPRAPPRGRGEGRAAPSRRARRGSTRASLRGRLRRGSSSLRLRRRSGARRRARR